MNTNQPTNPDRTDTTVVPENAAAAPAAATPARKISPLAIGAGVAAAIVLVGGGIAIGASISGDDDRGAAQTTAERSSDDGSNGGTGASDASNAPLETTEPPTEVRETPSSSSDDDASGSPSSAALAPSDAGALADAIESAIAAVSGTGATAIDVERGGWDVDVLLSDGTEAEVFVAQSGDATVRDTDTDRSRDPLIETDRLASIIDAAIAEAGGGSVESISTDDGPTRYEVSVLQDGGVDVEIELDDALDVLSVERD